MLKPNQKSQSSKKNQVEKMFDSISFEYDLLNGIMTFNNHKRWKKNILNIAKKLKPKNALDIATGTADIAINLGSIADCKVTGVDISEKMLNVGREKISKMKLSESVSLETGDAENLNFKDNHFDLVTIGFGVRNFQDLQKRIGRKTVSKKLQEDIPIFLMAYDLLELNGQDLREKPLWERQEKLDVLLKKFKSSDCPLLLSKVYRFKNWKAVRLEREQANKKRSEGLMIKHKEAPYGVGRQKGSWWKWKSDPKSIDAVLTYAMRGHGRRTNLYTDYTFALWEKGELVTFAKAYSGMTDIEIKKLIYLFFTIKNQQRIHILFHE